MWTTRTATLLILLIAVLIASYWALRSERDTAPYETACNCYFNGQDECASGMVCDMVSGPMTCNSGWSKEIAEKGIKLKDNVCVPALPRLLAIGPGPAPPYMTAYFDAFVAVGLSGGGRLTPPHRAAVDAAGKDLDPNDRENIYRLVANAMYVALGYDLKVDAAAIERGASRRLSVPPFTPDSLAMVRAVREGSVDDQKNCQAGELKRLLSVLLNIS